MFSLKAAWKIIEQTVKLPVIWDAFMLIWHHCNDIDCFGTCDETSMWYQSLVAAYDITTVLTEDIM